MFFKRIFPAFIFAALLTSAQSQIPEGNSLKSNTISLNLVGGPSAPLGISYSQLLNKHLSYEMGVGIFSAGIGLRYFITEPSINRIIPYTGLNTFFNFIDRDPMIYLPLGVSYINKKNFQFSADIGLLYSEVISISGQSEGPFSPWFGVKLGKQFGKELNEIQTAERAEIKNIISVNLGYFTIVLGINYERFITPNFSLEAGLGLIGVSVGGRYYFPSIIKNHLGFHIGAINSWGASPYYGYTGSKVYIPVGISYLSSSNIWYSFDIGPQINYQDDNDLWPSFNLRVGKAF